jgi:transposase InsO family protein
MSCRLEPEYAVNNKDSSVPVQLSFGISTRRPAGDERHGCPAIIRFDNDSEFQPKALDAWAYAHQVKLDFTQPGKPVENGFIESFNARVQDGCLNASVFVSVADARSTYLGTNLKELMDQAFKVLSNAWVR